MTSYTSEEIMKNRRIFIDYLSSRTPEQKAKYILDRGDGARCCIGHACHALGLEMSSDNEAIYYGAEGFDTIAPPELVEMIGFWDHQGGAHEDMFTGLSVPNYDRYISCLASLNDETDITPKETAQYLESVINGGSDTPFRRVV